MDAGRKKNSKSEALLSREEPDLANRQSTWKAKAPEEVRFGRKDHWRIMYEKQLQIFQQQSELPFSFEEIGTLDVERLQRRKRKIRRVTQGHGSMEGQ